MSERGRGRRDNREEHRQDEVQGLPGPPPIGFRVLHLEFPPARRQSKQCAGRVAYFQVRSGNRSGYGRIDLHADLFVFGVDAWADVEEDSGRQVPKVERDLVGADADAFLAGGHRDVSADANRRLAIVERDHTGA